MAQPLSRICGPLALVTALASTTLAQKSDAPQFGAPEQLTAAGKTMTGILYPSPTLYDINGDGQRDLVIGDLRGYITVGNRVKGAAGLTWSKLEQLQSDKKPLKLNNW